MIIFTIGRNKENKYIIHDPQALVSGRHGYLSWDKAGNITYIDTSTNGTIIKGNKYDEGSVVSVKRGDPIIFAGIAKLDWNKVPNIIYPDKTKNIHGIGRDSTNIIIIDEDSISRFHATIAETSDNKCYIIDHSSNGTKINNEQIVSYIFHRIKRRDKINFGIHNSALNWKKVPCKRRDILILFISLGFLLLVGLISLAYSYRCELNIVNCPASIKPAEFYDSAMVIVYNKFYYTENNPKTNQIISYFGKEGRKFSVSDESDLHKITPFEYFGTGFLISYDGKIATNRHVAAPWLDEKYNVVNFSIESDVIYSYTIVGQSIELGIIPNHTTINKTNFHKSLIYCDLSKVKSHDDPNVDLSIIQIASESLPTTSKYITADNFLLTDKSQKIVKRQDPIVVIAFPFSFGMWSNNVPTIKSTFDVGYISNITFPYNIHHSAPTAGGASGGILYHMPTGKIIGINYMMQGNTHNLALMIKYLEDLLN